MPLLKAFKRINDALLGRSVALLVVENSGQVRVRQPCFIGKLLARDRRHVHTPDHFSGPVESQKIHLLSKNFCIGS